MTAHSPDTVIVAAVASNGAIGGNNALLWRLPSDLKRFREITIDRPIIMGRKTYDSIGRPLPGRTNIVVSRNTSFMPSGIVLASSLDEAIDIAKADADHRNASEVMIIGGGQIYAESMEFADRLEITRVDASPKADVFFPEIEDALWRQTSLKRGTPTASDDHDFTFVTYEKRA